MVNDAVIYETYPMMSSSSSKDTLLHWKICNTLYDQCPVRNLTFSLYKALFSPEGRLVWVDVERYGTLGSILKLHVAQ